MWGEVQKLFAYAQENWNNFFISGVIMVSAITVFIGILKPLLFNRIPWKPLRRACLAFTNVGLCFASTAMFFFVEHMNYDIYWHNAISLSVFSIVCYWFYENTCLRDLIEKIGKFTLKKIWEMLTRIFNGAEIKEIEKEITLVSEELKANTKKELKSAKKPITDKELDKL